MPAAAIRMAFFVELSKYGVVGLIGTAVHYTIMAILIRGFSVEVVLSSTSGAMAGALVNYVLNYFYTFRSDKHHHEAMVKFWLIASLGWGLNAGILAVNEYLLGINVILAQLTATAVVFVVTFFLNRRWTF